MARRWLADGELEVITLRPHVQTVWLPILALLALALALGGGWRAIPESLTELRWLLVAVVGLLGLIFVVRPLARRNNTRYVLTTQRLLTRVGPFGRIVHDIPWVAVAQVTTRRGASGWLTGAGTLQVMTMDGFWLNLRKVPDVKRITAVMDELRADARRGLGPYPQPAMLR